MILTLISTDGRIQYSRAYFSFKKERKKKLIISGLNFLNRLQFSSLKLQTTNLANHQIEMIKQIKDLQYRILDHELNRWKREQQLAGNGAPFNNNLDTIQKW